MAAHPLGPMVDVQIINSTRASVVLSVWLTEPTSFGECGYRGFNLDQGGSTTTSLPAGCYGAGAFINSARNPSKAFGSGCIQGETKATITVSTEGIRVGR